MAIVATVALIIIIIYVISVSKKSDTNPNAPKEPEIKQVPVKEGERSLISLEEEQAGRLLDKELKNIYDNYSHFEKWERSGFILVPAQRVRVFFTNGLYEDTDVYFTINKHGVPLDVLVGSKKQDCKKEEISPEAEAWYSSNLSEIKKKEETARENGRISFIYSDNLVGQDVDMIIKYINECTECECEECNEGIRFMITYDK